MTFRQRTPGGGEAHTLQPLKILSRRRGFLLIIVPVVGLVVGLLSVLALGSAGTAAAAVGNRGFIYGSWQPTEQAAKADLPGLEAQCKNEGGTVWESYITDSDVNTFRGVVNCD